MEVIYQIHTYFEHCNVNFDGKIYNYSNLGRFLTGQAFVTRFFVKEKIHKKSSNRSLNP